MGQPLSPPIRYRADVEDVDPTEGQTIADLEASFDRILETTAKDYGKAVRAVHAKGHAIVLGEFEVHGDLPPEYAQGLFATPGRYRAALRFSTNAGDILDDSIGLPRGLAIKIVGVEGERLAGSEGDATQDFVLANGPVFAAPTPAAFSRNLKLLAATTDKAQWAKKAFSTVLRGAEATVEAFGGQSVMLKTMGGAANVHPLGETYWSQTPFRYGDHIAKFQLVPISGDLVALTGEVIDAAGRPDAIREDTAASMRKAQARWELRVQLCRDLETMPVEDATAEWDVDDSPFVTVATLIAAPQNSWDAERVMQVDEGLRFSVWTGLAAHRPLGGVNRARKDTYQHSADFRSRVNGCPLHEPA